MRKSIDITKRATPEQIVMLKKASQFPVVFDEDCPPFSEKDLLKFKKISHDRNFERQKQNVTIRLSPKTIQRAKSLGKGYTSILGRILESALENPETIEHYL